MTEQSRKIENMLEDIKHFTGNYSKDLQEGKVASLAVFEEKIKLLCDQISGVSQDVAMKYEAELKSLIDTLSDWSIQLKEYQDNLKTNLAAANNKLKAEKAYSKMVSSNDN